MKRITRRYIASSALVVLIASGCGDSTEEPAAAPSDAAETSEASASGEAEATGIRLVSAVDGAAIQDDPPEDLVILDVRTPEEFAAGHLDGAVMVDFYDNDFAAQLAELDPDVPYLLYCESGNRSGQTATILDGLGFTDVADVDGGISAWKLNNLPTVAE